MSGATKFCNLQAIDSRCNNVLQATCDICNKCKLCCTITAESSMPFATPKRYGKIAVGLCDKCRGSFQATCRHVQCLMLTCNNKKVLPFATPKRYGKIAVGLCDKCRGSFQATCRHLYNVLNAHADSRQVVAL